MVLEGQEPNWKLYISIFSVFAVGIFTSHLFRMLIIYLEWAKKPIGQLIWRVLAGCIGFSLVFQAQFYMVSSIFINQSFEFNWVTNAREFFNWNILLLIWSLIYFTYHFFENFRKEEIKNLQWEARKNEIELNRLKSQMNPHFIFNSMNTIRALVDEDPAKAKASITQLANILRNTLMMGKERTISLERELSVVRDYLQIEKTRFEERLNCKEEVEPITLNYHIPSLMLQTIVENAIKHGIGTLPYGGLITVRAKEIGQKLLIQVENDGTYNPVKKETGGVGIENTKERLALLYGDDASINMFNSKHNTVITELNLPALTN